MKRFLPLIALAFMTGAATPSAAPSSDPSGNLGMWEGRWTFSGQIYGTAYSHAHGDTGIADCVWAANRGYLSCDYFSDNPPHDNLTVLSYSAVAKAYTLVQVSKDTPPDRSTLARHGNAWITSSTFASKGKMLVMRTTFTFLSANEQTTRVEVSADKEKTWTKIIEVRAQKVRS